MTETLWTAEEVIARLEQAGATLMALRVSGLRPAGYKSGRRII